LRYDDPRLEEIKSSFQLVQPAEASPAAVQAKENGSKPRPDALVKGITPTQAPASSMKPAVTAVSDPRPGVFARVWQWLTGISASPAAKPADPAQSPVRVPAAASGSQRPAREERRAERPVLGDPERGARGARGQGRAQGDAQTPRNRRGPGVRNPRSRSANEAAPGADTQDQGVDTVAQTQAPNQTQAISAAPLAQDSQREARGRRGRSRRREEPRAQDGVDLTPQAVSTSASLALGAEATDARSESFTAPQQASVAQATAPNETAAHEVPRDVQEGERKPRARRGRRGRGGNETANTSAAAVVEVAAVEPAVAEASPIESAVLESVVLAPVVAQVPVREEAPPAEVEAVEAAASAVHTAEAALHAEPLVTQDVVEQDVAASAAAAQTAPALSPARAAPVAEPAAPAFPPAAMVVSEPTQTIGQATPPSTHSVAATVDLREEPTAALDLAANGAADVLARGQIQGLQRVETRADAVQASPVQAPVRLGRARKAAAVVAVEPLQQVETKV